MTTPNLISDLQRDEGEIWRLIKPGYEVSDHGRVRNTTTGYLLKPSPRRNYLGRITHYAVNLGRNDMRRVHLLVLEAFVGHRPPGLEGCHNDGRPSNNRLGNLRWDTHLSNMADSVRHGTKTDPPVHRRGSNARTWLNEDDVRCIRSEPQFRGVNQMLGRCFGVSYMTIRRIREAA